MKKLIILLFCLVFYLQPVAAESSFQVAIINEGDYTILYENTLKNAQLFYNNHLNDYDNLLLLQNGYVIDMEYGIASVDTDANCSVNVEYTSVNNNSDGYINGCYGKDAAYIKTSSDYRQVDFVISGDYGRGSIDDITLIPIEKIINISDYVVIDGELFHQIKSDLTSLTYASKIDLGIAPDYLVEDTNYYSYDGHYFYVDIKTMLEDYQNQTYKNCINYVSPYYNYYMYLSHRSISNYNSVDLDGYFRDYLLIDNSLKNFISNYSTSVSDVFNQSQYYDEMTAFLFNQYRYGSNSMLMLSLSMNETATGRSSLSFRRNNLFGHAAYDSSVEASAKRYTNLENSITSHAKNYISAAYLNPDKFQYHGGFLGNKESGMNVSYASDPYWGEKAASYYSQIDIVLGNKDLNKYKIGISNDYQSVDVFDQDNNVLYTNTNNNSAYIILGETADYYIIQSDVASDKENFTYDFNTDIAYVLKSDLDVFIGNESDSENSILSTYIYDANGGYYFDNSQIITLNLDENNQLLNIMPSKTGYIFDGYTKKDNTYIANYQKLQSIKVVGDYQTTYQLNDKLNFDNLYLEIEVNDITTKINLNTNFVDKSILDTLGSVAINVNYYGNTTSFLVNVTDDKTNIFLNLDSFFDNYKNISTISDDSQYTELYDNLILANENEYNYLSDDDFRNLDKLIFDNNKNVNYILNNNGYDVSLSGVAIDTLASKKNFLIKDNVTVNINASNDENLNKLVTDNQYQTDYQFNISIKYNNTEQNINNYLLVSILKPETDIDNTKYYVFVRNSANDIIRLSTTQSSNYITFKTNFLGNYIVASKINTVVELDNPIENLNINTSEQNSFVSLYNLIIKVIIGISALLIILFIIKKVRKSQCK